MAGTNENEAIELATVLKQKQAEVNKVIDEVKGLGEELKGKMDKSDRVTDEVKHDVDKLLTEVNGLKSQIHDLEQAQARNPVTPEVKQTLGDWFVKSNNYKNCTDLREKGQISVEVNRKAIGGTAGQFSGDASALLQPQVVDLVSLPQQQLRVRDLLMQGHTDAEAIYIPQEAAFDNRASGVKEGELKPESNITFTSTMAPVITLAHFIKASKQILSDASALRSIIDGRLQYGLKLKEEEQLLKGRGVQESNELIGLIPNATPFMNTTNLKSYSIIDQLRLAMLQVVLSGYSATGHILNPIQWAEIETAKDEVGRYIIGNPQGTAVPMMWGQPVVSTSSMPTGQFLTGAFKMAAQIFDRWDMKVDICYSDKDDFTRNMVTILCEERLALAIYRKDAFVTGTLQSTLPPTLPPAG